MQAGPDAALFIPASTNYITVFILICILLITSKMRTTSYI